MGTEKPRFTITMEEELLQAIDDYKFDKKIKNQSKAIVQLARIGLQQVREQEEQEIKKASDAIKTTSEATQDIEKFKLLLEKAGFLQGSKDISDDDLIFLESMFSAIKSYFRAKK